MFCRNTNTAKNHAITLAARAESATNEIDREFFQREAEWWATTGVRVEEMADDVLKEVELTYRNLRACPIAYYIDHFEELLWLYFSDDDEDCEYYMINWR